MVAQITQEPKLILPNTHGTMQVFTASDRTFFGDVIAQALRLGGQGRTVMIVQFLQGGIKQGVDQPRNLAQNVDWFRCDLSRQLGDILTAAESTSILAMWQHTRTMMAQGTYDVMILDGLDGLLERSLVSEAEIIETLKQRPYSMDVTLTAATLPDSVVNIADQVTQRRR